MTAISHRVAAFFIALLAILACGHSFAESTLLERADKLVSSLEMAKYNAEYLLRDSQKRLDADSFYAVDVAYMEGKYATDALIDKLLEQVRRHPDLVTENGLPVEREQWKKSVTLFTETARRAINLKQCNDTDGCVASAELVVGIIGVILAAIAIGMDVLEGWNEAQQDEKIKNEVEGRLEASRWESSIQLISITIKSPEMSIVAK